MNIRYFQIFFISFIFALLVGGGLYGFGHDFYAGYYRPNLDWGGFTDRLGFRLSTLTIYKVHVGVYLASFVLSLSVGLLLFKAKKMNPKVSIVTSVYNGEKYLEETIKNVLAQTYQNIEYIIIDGGSTDGTIDIIKKYEDELAYWISEQDNGMYDGINKGFEKATGDIFAYINADDLYYDENVVRHIVNMFDENKSLSLVFGNIEFIDEKSKHLYFYKSLALPRYLIQFLQRVPFAQQTAFWNAKVYRELKGFDISLKYVADSKFFFSILFNKKYKYKKINEYIAKFRWHSEGFSSAQKEMMNLESINMKKELSYFKNSLIMKTLVELFIKLYNLKNIIIKKLLNES